MVLADVDDRVAPPPRRRRRLRHRPRPPARSALGVGQRSDRRVQLRRRLGEPFDRHRSDQHRLPLRAISACLSRCCSSARTTASASASAHRRTGSRSAYGHRPHLRYARADGFDPAEVFDVAVGAGGVGARAAGARVPPPTDGSLHGPRRNRRRVCVPEPEEIRRDYDRDPLLGMARLLVSSGLLTSEGVVKMYEATRRRCAGSPRRPSPMPNSTRPPR